MRVTYWSPHYQNLPHYWQYTRLVRIKGNKHDERTIRDIVHNVKEYMNHTFLLFSSELDDFYDIPNWPVNIIPVLHVSTQAEYNEKVDEYMAFKHPNKVLSIFSHGVVRVDCAVHAWEWVFLSGFKYTQTITTMNNIQKQKIPLHFEYWLGSRNVPQQFNICQIPAALATDVSTTLGFKCPNQLHATVK